MKAKPCGLALALLLCVSGGGCTSSEKVEAPARHPGRISSSLVMQGAGWAGAGDAEGVAWRAVPGAWEYGRNDARLNAGPPSARYWHEWAEIRNHNRTRTTNGRPREFSTTFVRTYSLRQVQ
jgi:hypothetical protein